MNWIVEAWERLQTGADPGIRLMVCGGRDYTDWRTAFGVLDEIDREHSIDVVIHGACPYGGADWIGEWWAIARGRQVERFPIDHAIDGGWPACGPRRSRRMIRLGRPDGVVAFPGGRGTAAALRMVAEAGIENVWEPFRWDGPLLARG